MDFVSSTLVASMNNILKTFRLFWKFEFSEYSELTNAFIPKESDVFRVEILPYLRTSSHSPITQCTPDVLLNTSHRYYLHTTANLFVPRFVIVAQDNSAYNTDVRAVGMGDRGYSSPFFSPVCLSHLYFARKLRNAKWSHDLWYNSIWCPGPRPGHFAPTGLNVELTRTVVFCTFH